MLLGEDCVVQTIDQDLIIVKKDDDKQEKQWKDHSRVSL